MHNGSLGVDAEREEISPQSHLWHHRRPRAVWSMLGVALGKVQSCSIYCLSIGQEIEGS